MKTLASSSEGNDCLRCISMMRYLSAASQKVQYQLPIGRGTVELSNDERSVSLWSESYDYGRILAIYEKLGAFLQYQFILGDESQIPLIFGTNGVYNYNMSNVLKLQYKEFPVLFRVININHDFLLLSSVQGYQHQS
jgi:hypothetical protein